MLVEQLREGNGEGNVGKKTSAFDPQNLVMTKCTSFVSRPDLLVPTLEIRIKETARTNGDYWLFGTWGGACQTAPYIFDEDGQLVWSGYTTDSADLGYFDLKRHELANGSWILSVFRGKSEWGCGKGRVILLDDSYQLRDSLGSEDTDVSLDFHEFQILDKGTNAILVKTKAVQGDLSSNGMSQGLSWIRDCIFQEIDLENGHIVFEWRATDHVPFSESIMWPDQETGVGLSSFLPFDYFHMNSVDKFPDGDYLVSARHTDCVYKVSSQDGSIIWRLGGKNSSFVLSDFSFSAQHDARIRVNAGGELRISLFNNGWNGVNQTRNSSSAMFIELDQLSSPMIARLVEEHLSYHGGLARHQGSLQVLPNSNRFVSWGGIAEFSEFRSTGERILDVAFEDTEAAVYRTAKSQWKGWPSSSPDLYVYALNESSPSHFYMSWNGATEIASWKVFAADPVSGGKTFLDKVEKRGFETHLEARNHVAVGFAEGLDRRGKVLGQSAIQSVIIPPVPLRSSCGRSHCTNQRVLWSNSNTEVPELGLEHVPGQSMLWPNTLLQGLIMAGAGYVLGRFTKRPLARTIST